MPAFVPLSHHDSPALPPSLTGAEVRARRMALGWSREQLAHEVGVPASEVTEWEAGERIVSVGYAVRHALERAETRSARIQGSARDERDEPRL